MSEKIAVLFDCENISSKYIDSVFKKLEKDKILIKQAFKDWSRKDDWDRNVCEKYAIEPIQVFSTTHKNSCDLRMQTAIFDILEYNVINTIAIISSDSDFRHIATWIKKKGIRVIGFGEAKTSDALQESYNHFIDLSSLLEELKQALIEAIQKCPKKDGAWCYLAEIGKYIKVKEYNKSSLKKVLKEYDDMIECNKDSNGQLIARIKQTS